ncbi:MAG TPA: hypothetical protein VNE21_08165 [Mycobacteriales bacterium]|nr:hypothetical protein [Mycobacteriales bacterium]
MNQEEVDIARLVAVPPSRRPEDTGKEGAHLPALELAAKPIPQFIAKTSEQYRDLSRNVIPVELVYPVSTHQRGSDDPLLNKPGHTPSDAYLGTARRLLRELSDG